MSFLGVVDRARTTLAVNITAEDTSFTVATGGGGAFKNLTENFVVTIEDEKILISQRNGDTFLIAKRGYDGSTPAPHTAGKFVELRVIARHIKELQEKITELKSAGHERAHNINSTDDHSGLQDASGYVLIGNANGLFAKGTNTDSEISAAVGKAHNRTHGIASSDDHQSGITPGKILMANANGLPVEATNTDSEVTAAVSHISAPAPHSGHETPSGAWAKVVAHAACEVSSEVHPNAWNHIQASTPHSGHEPLLTFSTGLTRAANTITANLSTGVAGGQSVIGGTASGNNLTLSSTSHATKGRIILGNSAYNEATNQLGIGTQSPTTGYALDVAGFINTNQTVDQNTYPSVNTVQTAATLQDGSSGNTGTDEAFDNTWEAIKFTASGGHTIRSFGVRIRVSAALSNSMAFITGLIYSDNAGVPGTQLSGSGSSFVRYGALGTSYAEHQFAVTATLVSGTSYWLVLRQSAAPIGGTIFLDSGTTGIALHAFSSDGANWTTENGKQCWHRIYGRTYYAINASSTNSFAINASSIGSFAINASSVNNYGVYAASVSNFGIYATSTVNTAIYATTPSGYGVWGVSTGSYGIVGDSTSGVACWFTINPVATSTVAEVMRLTRRTSGTAANGIGGSVDLYVEDSAGADELSGRIACLLTTATNGSETSALTFWTRTGGAAIAERVRIDGSGRVGIGTTAPASCAILDLTTTSMGFLPPRMTTSQRDAIGSPVAGLVIYNTTTNKLNVYNGTAWEVVSSS